MKGDRDEEDDVPPIDCECESDEHAGENDSVRTGCALEKNYAPMQEDAELDDGHSDDLHYHGVGKRCGRGIERAVSVYLHLARDPDSPISMFREVCRGPCP